MIDPVVRAEVRQAEAAEEILLADGIRVMRGRRERVAHILTVFTSDEKRVHRLLRGGLSRASYQMRRFSSGTLNLTFFAHGD